VGAAAPRVALAALLSALVLGHAQARAATPGAEAAYDRGVAAYRDGKFEEARAAFEQARRQGMRGPNLVLNLGLAHYRLGQYFEARACFEEIRSDLRYTALADYHLGLVAARLGEREPAAAHFESVQYMASNPRLRNMALVAMMRMDNLGLDYDPFSTAAAAPRPDLYARLAAGFDSNPELIADRLEDAREGEGAAYGEVRADMNLPLLVGAAGETYLRADAQLRQYGGERGFDQASGEVELRQAFTAADWRWGISAEGGQAWLDGDAYEAMAGAGVDARRELPLAALTLRADSVRVNGEGEFEYLDGWRHRAGMELGRPVCALRARANYEYEHNERLDLTRGGEFHSHSPRRHALGLAAVMPVGGRASLEGRARYRHSDYPEPNRISQGGTTRAQMRRDELATLGLRGRLRAGPSWNWIADLQYNRNDSAIAEYGYTRYLFLAGIEWLR
jgi:tetratricopeptide (TPR) repeat protein